MRDQTAVDLLEKARKGTAYSVKDCRDWLDRNKQFDDTDRIVFVQNNAALLAECLASAGAA